MAYQKRISYRGVGLESFYSFDNDNRIFYAQKINNSVVIATKEIKYSNIANEDFIGGMKEDFIVAAINSTYSGFSVILRDSKWIILYSEDGAVKKIEWSKDLLQKSDITTVIGTAYRPKIFTGQGKILILFIKSLIKNKFFAIETEDFSSFKEVNIVTDSARKLIYKLPNKNITVGEYINFSNMNIVVI